MRKAKRHCTNRDDLNYKDYGGRGIEFRFTSPQAAAQWVRDNLGVVSGKVLDRIDADGHYEPGNLHWTDPTESIWNWLRGPDVNTK